MTVTIGDCPTIIAEIHNLSDDVITGQSSFYGEITVELQCMPGYTLIGNRVLTCANGTWDVEPPDCVHAQHQGDTASITLPSSAEGQHGGHDGYGRIMTSHELLLIIGSCATCLVVIAIVFGLISIVKCVRMRRRLARRQAAAIKLPSRVSSNSSSGATPYDNQSFMYENAGINVSDPITSCSNSSSCESRGDPSSSSPEMLGTTRPTTSLHCVTGTLESHESPQSIGNCEEEPEIILSIKWHPDKLGWHEAFDYSRVKIPRPQLVWNKNGCKQTM